MPVASTAVALGVRSATSVVVVAAVFSLFSTVSGDVSGLSAVITGVVGWMRAVIH